MRSRRISREIRRQRGIDMMVGLIDLVEQKFPLSPTHHDKDLLIVKYRCEFEPHGRASETWEGVWQVILPRVQEMMLWGAKAPYEWRPRRPGKPMMIEGEYLEEVAAKTMFFLRDAPWTLLIEDNKNE